MPEVIRLKNRGDFRVHRGFQWIDKNNDRHYPKDMSTHHVFYTLLMIWNHSAPEDMKIHPYKRYTFSSSYTSEYMANAVKSLMIEFSKRDDVEIYLHKFNQIRDNVRTLQKQMRHATRYQIGVDKFKKSFGLGVDD